MATQYEEIEEYNRIFLLIPNLLKKLELVHRAKHGAMFGALVAQVYIMI